MITNSFILTALITVALTGGKSEEKNSSGPMKLQFNEVAATHQPAEVNWDYVTIKRTILQVFPEAYPDLFEIAFTDWDDEPHPSTATFCVPDKYFPNPLSETELKKRASLLSLKFEYTGCEQIVLGEATMYSYAKWKDKKVRRVTFHFGIGC